MEWRWFKIPIAFDAVTVGTSFTTNGTFSHTTTGDNRLLIVTVNVEGTTSTAGTVSYAGVNLSNIINQSTTGAGANTRAEMWSLVNPTSGANNVIVQMNTGDNDFCAAALSFTGVTQTSPIEGSVSATGTSDTISNDITTVADNAWVVNSISNVDSTQTWTPGANQTERVDQPTSSASADRVYVSTEGPQTPAGVVTMSQNRSGVDSQKSAHVLASFAPVAAVAAVTIAGWKSLMGVGN